VFERFTQQARQVVVGAQEEARAMGHGSIDTEHVLLALVDDEDGIPAHVFADLAVTSAQVRGLVAERLGPGSAEVTEGGIPFSPVAEKVLEVSQREALPRRHEIGPEHLLLGIVRVKESGASQILAAVVGDTERVRVRVRGHLPNLAPEPPASAAGLPRGRPEQVASVSFTSVPDAALARLLFIGAGIALSEERTAFDIADVLRAAVRDTETLRRLDGLGVDLGAIRERFGQPPAA
jgi:hypothetical protein